MLGQRSGSPNPQDFRRGNLRAGLAGCDPHEGLDRPARRAKFNCGLPEETPDDIHGNAIV